MPRLNFSSRTVRRVELDQRSREASRGTEGLQTRRWRKPDSNPQSRSVIRELSGYTPSCSIR
jgi:hypothetical protein